MSVCNATPINEDVLELPADKGLSIGWNSIALAFMSQGNKRGEDDVLVT